jgi:hypothetical protein
MVPTVVVGLVLRLGNQACFGCGQAEGLAAVEGSAVGGAAAGAAAGDGSMRDLLTRSWVSDDAFGKGEGNSEGGPDPGRGCAEAGTFVHEVEGEMLVKLTNEMIPYFNAGIYLQNKTRLGKVDEILGPVNQVSGAPLIRTLMIMMVMAGRGLG